LEAPTARRRIEIGKDAGAVGAWRSHQCASFTDFRRRTDALVVAQSAQNSTARHAEKAMSSST